MQAWIFQCNPDSFDIDGYLQATKDILWSVNQKHLAPQMHLGDRVFLWRAEGKNKAIPGIVASGSIVALPAPCLDVPSLPFWRRPAPPAERLRVRIQADRVAATTHDILKRSWMEEDPVLRNLRIFKMRNETNYLINDEHAERLLGLWRNTGRNGTEKSLSRASGPTTTPMVELSPNDRVLRCLPRRSASVAP